MTKKTVETTLSSETVDICWASGIEIEYGTGVVDQDDSTKVFVQELNRFMVLGKQAFRAEEAAKLEAAVNEMFRS